MATPEKSREAVALHRSGRLAEAERLYMEILAAAPDDFTARHLLGVARAQQGRNGEALDDIGAALALRPGDAEALLNHANVLKALGRNDEALAGFDRALAAKPDFAQALNNRGTVLQALGRFEEALVDYDRALAQSPAYAEALNNRGSVLQDLRRPAEALASYDAALKAQPAFAAAFNNRGSALLDLGRHGDALGCFDRALGLRPGDAEAHNNRGNALQGLLRHEEAVAAYDKALGLRPDYGDALANRGQALQELKRHDEALASFDAAMAQPIGQPHAFGGAAMAALNLNDWKRQAEIAAKLPDRIARGDAVPPWVVLGYSGDEALNLQAAANTIRRRFPHLPPPLWTRETKPYRHDKLRLGYISSDFCHHPVATQIAQLIECHDRAAVTVLGFSTGPDDGSAQRQRLAKSFDQFHDLRGIAPRDAAQKIRGLEVDVLIELNGHTQGDSFEILSHRPAPVQASWLGYPGTTAAPFVDFMIADRIVAPDPAGFSEELIYLPGSCYVTDTSRLPGTAPTREKAGLPELPSDSVGNAFVFCCFNNNWKIGAELFAAWLRLLAAVPGSVLWLKQAGDGAKANLRRAAQAQGIAAERLIFAAPAPIDVHLARHQLADLFLDTQPYNAHATACDALWSGLPVLTQAGTAYAGRVAASLLHAVGLPELVTESLEDYEALALALARDPARLKTLRQKLADGRGAASLFDTPNFARKLEAACAEMLAKQTG